MERKLAAIFSADVKGYSRLMGEDEEATIRTLTAYREVMTTLIQQRRGRVVDATGDNLLAEFASVVDAVVCAAEVQRELEARNAEVPIPRRMEFRVGINLGDVIVEGERIYGDGVNIAARLEALAEPGGICISGTAYDQVVTKLALEYDYLGEQAVKNIERPVRVYRVRLEPGAATLAPAKKKGIAGKRWRRVILTVVGLLLVLAGGLSVRQLFFRPPSAPALPLPDKPSIAVLPFANLSGDPEQEYFSDGMTEDLITDLSKLSGLFVIARNSVFTYKGKPVKPEQVGRELGVRYVLEGSVRKAENRVRITAQLVDATTGYHRWAERYDRELRDIFAVQEEVARKIVTALAVQLTAGEQERLARKYTDNLEAYDHYLRGTEYRGRATPETNRQARQRFERAIVLDPRFALAYAMLSFTYLDAWSLQWSREPQTLERGLALAQQAVALDDALPAAHMALGWAYNWKKQPAQAIAEHERAIALDPNNADGYASLAGILNFAGKPQDALRLVEKAMRLNPRYPDYYVLTLGIAYVETGRHEEAIAAFKSLLIRNPNDLLGHIFLAALYSGAGWEERARTEAAEVVRLNPQFSLEVWRQTLPLQDQAVLKDFLDLLRKAGLK